LVKRCGEGARPYGSGNSGQQRERDNGEFGEHFQVENVGHKAGSIIFVVFCPCTTVG